MQLKNEIEDVAAGPTAGTLRADRKSWSATLLAMMFLLFVSVGVSAQTNIANYSFAATTGATYTPITGGTTFASGNYDDTASAAITMGGTFPFGGVNFTTCFINTNGYITFGAAPSSSNYTPLSTLGGITGGVIAPFAQDAGGSTATGATPLISYLNTGTEFIVQFADHANFYNRTTERLNFQIRLTYATGAINVIYGTNTNPGTVSTTGTTPQVGIRGNSVAYATNVNNLLVGNIPASTTCDWSNAVTGYSNASTLLFSGTTNVNVKIPTGLRFTWTPGTILPVRTFSAVSGVTTTAATLSWTAPTGATQYNVQYRIPGTCGWTNFSGNPVSATSVSLTGLATFTSYQVRVQASNGTVNSIYSHIPNTAGTGDGYTATGTFTTLAACQSPTASTATATSSTSANLSWTASASAPSGGYEWEVRTSGIGGSGAVGLTSSGTTGAGVVTTSTSVLTSNTTYTLYVRSNCGGGVFSSWAASSAFTTPHLAGVPWSEGFATTTLPAGWVNTSSAWSIGSVRGVTGNPGNDIYKNLYSSATTGQFNTGNYGPIVSGQVFSVDYKLANFSPPYAPPAAGWGNFQVQISTNNGTTWATLETVSSPAVATWTTKTYPLTSYIGQNVSIRIIATWLAGDYDLAFDNFSIATPPTCTAPTAVVVSAITSTGATFSWTAASPAPSSGYQYEVRSTGAAGSGATGLADSGSTAAGVVTANSTILAASTTYSVYVRSFCGGTDYSAWTAGSSFTTLCNVATIPFNEGFNAASIPTCWSTQTVAVQSATAITFVSTGDYPTTAPQEGSNMVKYASFTTAATNGAEERLQSKPFATTGYSSIDVNFYWRNENNTSYSTGQYLSEGVQVQFSVNGGTTWTDTGSFIPRHDGTLAAGTAQWNLKTVSISGAANQANVIIGFKFHSGYGDNCYLDNVSILGSPPTVTSFAPSSLCNGGTVAERTITISGTLFTGATAVKVNGINVQSYTVDSDTQITAVASATNTSGLVSVTIPNGTGTSAGTLTIKNSPTVAPITGPSFVCLPTTNTITLSDATPTGVWSSSNADIATVSASGVVSPVSSGSVIISYTVTDTGCATSQTQTVTVNNPVVISSSTATQTVVTGGNTSFTVSASGTPSGALPGLTYQWEVTTDGENFTPLTNTGVYSGVDTATLSLTNIPASLNESLYHVIVTGACNAAASDLAVLIVGETGIDTQPSNATICNAGPGTASFSIVASEDVTTYQWQEDQGGDNWMDLTDGGIYSGSNTPTLSLSGLTLANSGWKYRCFVTGISSATSNAATLTVVPSATINTQPTAQTVCYTGGSATFNVGATGGIASYQWQYSANSGTSWTNVANGTPTGATYTGALTASLSVTTTSATPATGNYSYRAVVNGTAPCANVTSTGAQLNINNPAISSQPAATTVLAGNTATLSVSTTAATPTYQWQYATTIGGTYANVVNGTPVNFTYSGATSASLSITPSSAAAAGAANFYRVIVSSGAGCSVTSTSAQVTVTNYCASAATSSSDEDITNVTFGTLNNTSACASLTGTQGVATGSANLYSNFRSSVNAPVIYAGATTPIAVQITECAGTAYSHDVRVYFDFNHNGLLTDAGEEFIIYPYASSNTHIINANIVIPASALSGNTIMRVVCKESTTTGPCVVGSYGETEDYTVNLQPVPPCAGTPVAGTITSSATNVCISGMVTLTATGYTASASGISFQWYNSTGAIAGATSATYTTPVLTAAESYYFRATCANGSGFSDSNTITIGVNNPAVVSTTPNSRCGAGTVVLSATAASGNLNWYSASTGGSPLYTGSNFTTPTLTTTTAFYVENSIGGASSSIGAISPAVGAYATSFTGSYEIFNVSAPVNLTSVDLYPTGAGTVTVELLSSSGAVLQTSPTYTVTAAQANSTLSVVGTPVVMPVNFSIPVGTGYRLNLKSTSTATLTRNSAGAATTYGPVLGAITITGNSNSTPGYYYNFYNWSVNTGCSSARVAVTATVNTPPSLSLSSASASVCAGSVTPTVTISSNIGDYDSYVWSPASGVSGNENTGYAFNPAVSTVYTLTATNSTSGCNNTVTFSVTVNPYPTTVTVSPSSAAVCSNGPAQLLTAVGGIISKSVISGTDTTATVSNTTGTTLGPNPLQDYYGGTKQQWLYTASELTALGFASGSSISSFSLDLAASDGAVLNNLVVKMKNSAKTSFATTTSWETGLTTVRAAASYTPVAGLNNFALAAPFVWDGASSIVIEMNYSNNNGGVTTPLNSAKYSATSFLSTIFYRVDTTTAATIDAYESTASATYLFRNNVVFAITSPAATTWSSNVAGSLFTDSAATIPYTGAASATVYAKPSANATITATATSASGCSVSGQATITYGTATTWYVDADNDTYGNASAPTVLACTQPAGYVANNTDCNDNNASVYQSATLFVDADADGYNNGMQAVCYGATIPTGYAVTTLGADCNDANAAVYRSATLYVDADADGYDNGSQVVCYGANVPTGYSATTLGTDCNDNNAALHSTYSFYADADGDGFGTGSLVSNVCASNATTPPAGYSVNNTDCNDNIAAINPGHAEVLYNGVDDNCDGQLDEGFQLKTKLLPEVCGTTLASINSLIGITTLNVSGITMYRIKVVNGASTQIIERNVPHFTLQELATYDYATTYTVTIELQKNGVWLGYYGDPCLVSSPAVLASGGAAQVSPSQCGITLPRINTLIATTSLAGVTGYRFKVTNITNTSGSNVVQTIDRSLNWFSLTMLAQYNYGTTYRIEIAVKTNGVYSGFGSPCQVSSPASPTLTNCGGTIATPATLVSCYSIADVTQYRFQITRLSDNSVTTIDRNTNYFTFNMVPGYTAGAQYGVRVAVMTVGTWSPFGDACEITAPGGAARSIIAPVDPIATDSFKAVAYPNPFATAFGVEVTTSGAGNVQLRIYDMTGKLLESRNVNVSELNSQQIGDRYPSGVYNVIVTQGENIKTLRVIKR